MIEIGPELVNLGGGRYVIAGSQLDTNLTDRVTDCPLTDISHLRGQDWDAVEHHLRTTFPDKFLPYPNSAKGYTYTDPAQPRNEGRVSSSSSRIIYAVSAFSFEDTIENALTGETTARTYLRKLDAFSRDNDAFEINPKLPGSTVVAVQHTTGYTDEKVIHGLPDLAGMTLAQILKQFHFNFKETYGNSEIESVFQVGQDPSTQGVGMQLVSMNISRPDDSFDLPKLLIAYAHGFKTTLNIACKIQGAEGICLAIPTGKTDRHRLEMIT